MGLSLPYISTLQHIQDHLRDERMGEMMMMMMMMMIIVIFY